MFLRRSLIVFWNWRIRVRLKLINDANWLFIQSTPAFLIKSSRTLFFIVTSSHSSRTRTLKIDKDIISAALLLQWSGLLLAASSLDFSSSNLSFLSERVGLVSNPQRSSSPSLFPNPDANFLPSIEILTSLLWWAFENASREWLRNPGFFASPVYCLEAAFSTGSDGTAKLMLHN